MVISGLRMQEEEKEKNPWPVYFLLSLARRARTVGRTIGSVKVGCYPPEQHLRTQTWAICLIFQQRARPCLALFPSVHWKVPQTAMSFRSSWGCGKPNGMRKVTLGRSKRPLGDNPGLSGSFWDSRDVRKSLCSEDLECGRWIHRSHI